MGGFHLGRPIRVSCLSVVFERLWSPLTPRSTSEQMMSPPPLTPHPPLLLTPPQAPSWSFGMAWPCMSMGSIEGCLYHPHLLPSPPQAQCFFENSSGGWGWPSLGRSCPRGHHCPRVPSVQPQCQKQQLHPSMKVTQCPGENGGQPQLGGGFRDRSRRVYIREAPCSTRDL